MLRRHDLDGTGLWKQVVSQGHELLAAPMRLEIESEGKTYVAAGNHLALTEKAADRVQGSGSWTAGPIAGRTEFAFDYDGMMKVVLHFGSAGQRLDAMQLVIPLKTDEAWLMHPVTDLLRFHYAGRIPNGKGPLWDYGGTRREVLYTETGRPDANGKVWDSRHVGRWQLPGPFVPYIWLGGPERGIAWFAENDRDWSLAADRPTLEIRRQGAVTALVVRMVTRRVVLARPRTLTFGLMATPAKPMPESPVSFRRWWTGPPNEKTKDTVGCGFMGACYYWGAAGPCYAFHPALGNYSIYDEFARLRKGGATDPAFVDKWLAQFTDPEFAPLLKTYRAHVNWSVNFFSGAKWRSPHGVRADGLRHPLYERPGDQLGRGGPHVPRRMEHHRHRRPALAGRGTVRAQPRTAATGWPPTERSPFRTRLAGSPTPSTRCRVGRTWSSTSTSGCWRRSPTGSTSTTISSCPTTIRWGLATWTTKAACTRASTCSPSTISPSGSP